MGMASSARQRLVISATLSRPIRDRSLKATSLVLVELPVVQLALQSHTRAVLLRAATFLESGRGVEDRSVLDFTFQ